MVTLLKYQPLVPGVPAVTTHVIDGPAAAPGTKASAPKTTTKKSVSRSTDLYSPARADDERAAAEQLAVLRGLPRTEARPDVPAIGRVRRARRLDRGGDVAEIPAVVCGGPGGHGVRHGDRCGRSRNED